MPGTKLTEDAIKDVTEGLLEELANILTKDEYNTFFDKLQEAAGNLWDAYKGKPYEKIRTPSPDGKGKLISLDEFRRLF